jgi:formate-dependent nitrite reductase cytochrome c552 subunit
MGMRIHVTRNSTGLLAQIVAGLAVVALTSVVFAQDKNGRAKPPEQPLPYSHKTHAAVGLNCLDCHVNPEPGARMRFPAADTCMACHATIANDKPPIQKLSEFAKSGRPIPWVRVYTVPEYVFWSHRIHLKARLTCETCHGPVASRDALWKENDPSMDWCVQCHQQKNAGLGCGTSCHDEM